MEINLLIFKKFLKWCYHLRGVLCNCDTKTITRHSFLSQPLKNRSCSNYVKEDIPSPSHFGCSNCMRHCCSADNAATAISRSWNSVIPVILLLIIVGIWSIEDLYMHQHLTRKTYNIQATTESCPSLKARYTSMEDTL